MLATPVLGIQLSLMIIACHDIQGFRPAKKRVEVSAGCEDPLKAEEITDMTTGHLTNPAQDTGQVIGYSYATKLPAEELLMKPLAIPLGCQPKSFWPGTRKTPAKWLVMAGNPNDGCPMPGYAA
jgi:hypothetical protein